MTAPAYDAGNVFAKILRGELPSHKLYEDDVIDRHHGRDADRRRAHAWCIPKAPAAQHARRRSREPDSG